MTLFDDFPKDFPKAYSWLREASLTISELLELDISEMIDSFLLLSLSFGI